LKVENKILWISFGLGICCWILCGILEYFLFPGQTFWRIFFIDVPLASLIPRGTLVCCFLVFGLISSRVIAARSRAEQNLAANSEKLATTLRSISDPIIAVDRDAVVTFLNPAARNLLGWNAGEAQGLVVERVFILPEENGQPPGLHPVRHVLREGVTLSPSGPNPVQSKDGTARYVDYSAAPILDLDGVITGAVLVFRDAGDRKKIIEDLRREKEIAQRYLDTAGVIIIVLDEHGQVTLINQKGCAVLGYPESEIIGKNWFESFLPCHERDQAWAAFTRLLAGEPTSIGYFENSVSTKAGEERIIAWHNTVVTDAAGTVCGTLSLGGDITGRRRAAIALQESEERFRAMFTSAEDCIFIKDRDQKYTHVNPSMEKVVGRPAAELIGRHIDGFFEVGSPEGIRAVDTRVFAGETVEEEITRPIKGVPTTFHVIRMPIRDKNDIITAIYGIGRNITHRKRSEDALRENEARLQRQNTALTNLDMHKLLALDELHLTIRRITETVAGAIEVVRAGIWLYNDDHTNIQSLDLYDSKKEAHSDGIELAVRDYPAYFAALENNRTIAAHDARRDPRTRQFTESYFKPMGVTSTLGAPIHIGGQIAGVICCEHSGARRRWTLDEENFVCSMADLVALALEVDQHRCADKALRESEEKYRYLVEHANDGVVVVQDGLLTYVNPHLAQMLGYTVTELIGTPYTNYINPDELDKVRAIYEQRMAGKDTPRIYEASLRNKDGRHIDVELNAGVINYQGNPADFVFVRDLSYRSRAERSMQEAGDLVDHIFRESIDVLTMIDEDGTILRIGEAVEPVLGYDPGALIGKPIGTLIPPQPQEARDNLLEQLRIYGGVFAAQQIVRADGSFCVMDLTATIVPWNGRKAILATFRDVSERKQSAQALEFTKFTVDHMGDAAYWMGQDARFVYVNDSACRSLGYSREELLAMSVHDIDPNFPPERWPGHWHELRQRGTFPLESHHRAKDGRIIPVEITVNFVEFAGQQFNCAVVRDITERKRAERLQTALFEISDAINLTENLEEFLKIIHRVLGSMIDTTNFYVALYDEEKDLYSFPHNVDEYDGTDWTPQQLKKSLTDYVRRTGKPILANQAVQEELEAQHEIGLVGEPTAVWMGVPLKTAKAVIGVVAVQSYSDPDRYTEPDLHLLNFVSGHIALAIDRKQQEDAIRQSNARLDTLIQSIPDIVYFKDAHGRILVFNKTYEQLVGLTELEIAGRTDADILPAELAEQCAHSDEVVLQTGASLHTEEQLTDKNRNTIYFDTVKTPLYDSDGHAIGLVGVSRDITERKCAEEALRSSEERLALALEATSDALWEWNFPSRDIECSPRFFTMLGYQPDEMPVTYSTWASLLHPDDRKRVIAIVKECMRRERENFEMEFRLQTKAGDWRWVLCRGKVIARDRNGRPVRIIGTNVDLTEHKKTEEALRESEDQLRQSQKMEAIGRLAGGAAHDFNNLLSIITGHSELLLHRLDETSDLRHNADEIKEAAVRAGNLTRQLLAFSRKQVLEQRVFDLNTVVTRVEKMLRRLIGEDIELLVETDPESAAVKADPGQIEQVLFNLAVNARDAMPNGGQFTIRTINIDVSTEFTIGHSQVKPGPYVLLSISDTGHGIDDETRTRIFEPFFTTKEAGKGTGLGLSTVYGIVTQSGGYIDVFSTPGQGTMFEVYLPHADSDDCMDELEPTTCPLARGKGTILVVEDEEGVRDLVCEILAAQGYRVISAQDGADALEKARDFEGRIDLLLTDVVMPRMSGVDLAQQLSPLRQKMKVIYMSGYTDCGVLNNAPPNSAFLQKPFALDKLCRLVRNILDQNEAATDTRPLPTQTNDSPKA